MNFRRIEIRSNGSRYSQNSVNTLLFDRLCKDNARTPPKLAIYLRHIFNVPIYSLDFPAAKEMNVLVGIGTKCK